MPFAFLIVGLLLLISGARGTAAQLVGLVESDFTGKGNFIYWTASILLIGSLGYIQQIRPLSRAFLILVLIVLILKNGGFFNLFTQALAGVNANNDARTPNTTPNFSTGLGGQSEGAGASGTW